MTARAIMLQGTGSDVGKSVLVAALCRIAHQRGLSVAPFKPQNMSNNAHVCLNGGEIGRAQALQALAARVEPCVDFNPVLLKPESDRAAQVVVKGKVATSLDANGYMSTRDKLLPKVLDSFNRLADQYDLIIVEGAGSPAEVNLRQRDIANMGFATAAGVPVCLVGDIDRGGVIAAVVGTQRVLAAEDARYISSFLINKFRGDPALFDAGVEFIETSTAWTCLGVIPWIHAIQQLPAEDAVVLEQAQQSTSGKPIKIVAPLLSRIANFDDIDPLKAEPGVEFSFIPPGKPIPQDADVIVLLGTKSTIGDLQFFRDQGWHHDLYAHVRHGGRVLGICGGYQMLGGTISDPNAIDGSATAGTGLGLLDVTTRMLPDKATTPTIATCVDSQFTVNTYEIHSGVTEGTDTCRPVFKKNGQPEGAQDVSRKIQGTYLHGLFTNDAYRQWWLNQIRTIETMDERYNDVVDAAIDTLAQEVSAHCNVDALLASAKPVGWHPS